MKQPVFSMSWIIEGITEELYERIMPQKSGYNKSLYLSENFKFLTYQKSKTKHNF